jgi:hypothetical protein
MTGVDVTIHNEPKSARLPRLMPATGTIPQDREHHPGRRRPAEAEQGDRRGHDEHPHGPVGGEPRDRGGRRQGNRPRGDEPERLPYARIDEGIADDEPEEERPGRHQDEAGALEDRRPRPRTPVPQMKTTTMRTTTGRGNPNTSHLLRATGASRLGEHGRAVRARAG